MLAIVDYWIELTIAHLSAWRLCDACDAVRGWEVMNRLPQASFRADVVFEVWCCGKDCNEKDKSTALGVLELEP